MKYRERLAQRRSERNDVGEIGRGTAWSEGTGSVPCFVSDDHLVQNQEGVWEEYSPSTYTTSDFNPNYKTRYWRKVENKDTKQE